MAVDTYLYAWFDSTKPIMENLSRHPKTLAAAAFDLSCPFLYADIAICIRFSLDNGIFDNSGWQRNNVLIRRLQEFNDFRGEAAVRHRRFGVVRWLITLTHAYYIMSLVS
jgi:hypothetical protein